MPNSEHRKKTLRQDQKRNEANRASRAAMRTAIKGARAAIEEDPKTAGPAVSAAFKRLDKAAKGHLIHANKAARAKSQLARAVNGS